MDVKWVKIDYTSVKYLIVCYILIKWSKNQGEYIKLTSCKFISGGKHEMQSFKNHYLKNMCTITMIQPN